VYLTFIPKQAPLTSCKDDKEEEPKLKIYIRCIGVSKKKSKLLSKARKLQQEKPYRYIKSRADFQALIWHGRDHRLHYYYYDLKVKKTFVGSMDNTVPILLGSSPSPPPTRKTDCCKESTGCYCAGLCSSYILFKGF